MEIVLYLAMTAAEFHTWDPGDQKIGWMACHFSPYGTGLSNLPQSLPEGSLLILNDRTPICGHDPQLIARQLAELVEQLKCSGILLDLQRPDADAVAAAVAALPCAVAATPSYARKLSCAVFLPPLPMTTPLEEYILPWQGRQIWLEVAPQRGCIRVTKDGSRAVDALSFPCPHVDEKLHCRYGIEVSSQQVDFHFHRDGQQLHTLMSEALQQGISHFVGLYQQFGSSSQATAQETARFQL